MEFYSFQKHFYITIKGLPARVGGRLLFSNKLGVVAFTAIPSLASRFIIAHHRSASRALLVSRLNGPLRRIYDIEGGSKPLTLLLAH